MQLGNNHEIIQQQLLVLANAIQYFVMHFFAPLVYTFLLKFCLDLIYTHFAFSLLLLALNHQILIFQKVLSYFQNHQIFSSSITFEIIFYIIKICFIGYLLLLFHQRVLQVFFIRKILSSFY